jgi:hypothetical protein
VRELLTPQGFDLAVARLVFVSGFVSVPFSISWNKIFEFVSVLFSISWIKIFRFFYYLLCSYDDFLHTSVSYLVKYAKYSELLYLFDFGYRSFARGFVRID